MDNLIKLLNIPPEDRMIPTGRRITGLNGKTAIHVTSDSIKILHNKKATNPLGIVSITPKIQIELGRDINEFIGYFVKLDGNMAIQHLVTNGSMDIFKVVKLKVADQEFVEICTITSLAGKIVAITFNKNLVYNKEFIKHEGISDMHLISAGKNGETALKEIARITNEPMNIFSVNKNENYVTVFTLTPEQYHYKYVFARDMHDNYRLVTILIE